MKRSLLITLALFVALAALLLVAAATAARPNAEPAAPQASAPTVVSYQGQVTVSGAPYSGTGYFKFAVVNAAGDASYWSNS